jgi:hypothetical protein
MATVAEAPPAVKPSDRPRTWCDLSHENYPGGNPEYHLSFTDNDLDFADFWESLKDLRAANDTCTIRLRQAPALDEHDGGCVLTIEDGDPKGSSVLMFEMALPLLQERYPTMSIRAESVLQPWPQNLPRDEGGPLPYPPWGTSWKAAL